MNVRLVPNTGIQYHVLPDGIPTAGAGSRSFVFEVRERAAQPGSASAPLARIRERARRGADEDDVGLDEEDPSAFKSRSASPGLLLTIASSLDGGAWFPIPFDRGGAWVCLFLRPHSKAVGTYEAALAVDTTFESNGNPEGVPDGDEGSCLPYGASAQFWSSPAVSRAIRELVDRVRRKPDAEKIDPLALQLAIAAMAEHLKGGDGGFDEGKGLQLHLEPKPEAGRTNKVDLVLDLGNSRTCALLVEESPQFRQERLELVYPKDPFEAHVCPFDSHFAFVAHEVLPAPDEPIEEPEGFCFLSQIVMGPRAGDLLRNMQFDPQTVGMTSPKRYLWDTAEPVRWQWRMADRNNPLTQQPPVIRGNVLRHMNPAAPLSSPTGPVLPVQPNYPRQACAVWTLIEILEQAFRQINSPTWRRASFGAPQSERRREIANLVVMYPAGMHSEEIRSYRNACMKACALWSQFRTNPASFSRGERVPLDSRFGVPEPKVHMICDEGLAIQTCWLYGEAVHRYEGDAAKLLKYLGRPRGPDVAKVDTLRVASLDIGGGTIDLAIADYQVDRDMPAATALTCKRLFHDGISRAGDEVVRAILEEEVFHAISRECGIDLGQWNQAFLRDETERTIVLRRQLVRNVWMPIAKACLEATEETGVFESKLGAIKGVSHAKLLELERLFFRDKNRRSLLDVDLKIDRKRMLHIIRLSVGRTIANCCDIVDQYQCDLLIVGGRPSSNPAIRQQILQGMAVPPGQVVFLSEWRAGDWYPFATSGQRVGDAKTCGVVGAAIVFRALYGHGMFRIRGEQTEEPKPIIGHPMLDRVAMAANSPLHFKDSQRLELDGKCELKTPVQWGTDDGVLLALRRIDHANAEAKPIYLLRLKSKYKRALQANPVAQDQITVRFRRGESKLRREVEAGSRIQLPLGAIPDVVELDGVSGEIRLSDGRTHSGDDAMELVLRTMIDGEGYWIDTGRFKELAPRDLESEGPG